MYLEFEQMNKLSLREHVHVVGHTTCSLKSYRESVQGRAVLDVNNDL